MRRFILDRDGWRCQRCGRAGVLEVDHVNGDPADDRPDNLRAMCRSCHVAHHRRPLTAAEARWGELVRELSGDNRGSVQDR